MISEILKIFLGSVSWFYHIVSPFYERSRTQDCSMNLNLSEILCVSTAVIIVYLSFLTTFASYHGPISNPTVSDDYWGYLPSLWDHPEPNYVIIPFIAEFFSVITAFPLSGFVLIYLSIKYKYYHSTSNNNSCNTDAKSRNTKNKSRKFPKISDNIQNNKNKNNLNNTNNTKNDKKVSNCGIIVMGLYCIICFMYTMAFLAHTTLSPLLMSITLSSVLFNGVYTFYHFSFVVGTTSLICFIKFDLKSLNLRFTISCIAFTIIVAAVIILPHILGPYGGVPTLTVVQTPAVLLATIFAHSQLIQKRNILLKQGKHISSKSRNQMKNECNVYKLLRFAGTLLICAMSVSFVEIYVERENASIFGVFPYLHVTIHILEQVTFDG